MTIGVSCQDDALMPKAMQIASMFNLKLNSNADITLVVSNDKLMLQLPKAKPLYVDFTTPLQKGKRFALAKACMVDKKPFVVDTTAGWGRDAYLLAHLGARVVMCERNPIMALLLQDGLTRLEHSHHHLNLELISGDAKSYLSSLKKSHCPDVILCDPMHPSRTKSALVKKDMQALQLMIGQDDDKTQLVQLALSKARHRVVVKWPAKAPALLSQPANFSYRGKTTRYDVYLSDNQKL